MIVKATVYTVGESFQQLLLILFVY